MIGFNVPMGKFKNMFFDIEKIKGAVRDAAYGVLNHFGGYVRKVAKSSIKKKRYISEPGRPPLSHAGFLKEFIWYGYEKRRQSVVIGPARLNAKIGNAPEALEYGGESKARIKKRGKTQTVGMKVRARPFMRPALAVSLPKLDEFWKDSISKRKSA